MVQRVLALKINDLDPIPGDHIVEGENQLPQAALWIHARTFCRALINLEHFKRVPNPVIYKKTDVPHSRGVDPRMFITRNNQFMMLRVWLHPSRAYWSAFLSQFPKWGNHSPFSLQQGLSPTIQRVGMAGQKTSHDKRRKRINAAVP